MNYYNIKIATISLKINICCVITNSLPIPLFAEMSQFITILVFEKEKYKQSINVELLSNSLKLSFPLVI